MSKLLAAYRANPGIVNAEKVVRYNNKHPFASLLLSEADAALLAEICTIVSVGKARAA